ncbi:hypothetical protein LY01_02530 [Nonlabens xylanidelens]|uniref:Uncharacterized protein n=1 Tax=Nonlabens xylanidelens TaxID=191564 RepID=A0A2S6IGA1_9FLAO|nr:hypothetical protein [Nonlabens xylanidelens]PPK93245.1 hypothetical protein LY01_02530 [Nonlabens xylanidelens]PQJ20930.1 hypothetical protein BST94_05435 [Nonlabens xylanidelens]
MKRFIIYSFSIFILILSNSCAELAAGLSSYNQANGTQCRQSIVDPEVYLDGKYQNKIMITDSEGNDIEYNEERWRASKAKTYLGYSFGIYYATSPYSELEYRFTHYCSSYY